MKRFNPIAMPGSGATPGSGSGAIVSVAAEEPQDQERQRGRWRNSRPRFGARPRFGPPARRVTVIMLAPNPAQNGLQIYFPGKPDETLRTELKGAGWRWSSWNVCWYHRDTSENLAWATAFIARHGGQSEVEVRPPIEDKIVPLVVVPLVGRDTPCAPVRPSEVATPGSGQPGGSR